MHTDKRNALAIILLKAYALALFAAIISMHVGEATAADWPDATGPCWRTSGNSLPAACVAVKETAVTSTGSCPGGQTAQIGTMSTAFEYTVHCYIGASFQGVGTQGNIVAGWTCTGGATVDYSHNPPWCVNSICITNQGKFFDFDFAITGTSTTTPPVTVCQETCLAHVVRASAMGFILADGTQMSSMHGTARVSPNACDSGVLAATRTGAFRNTDSTPTAQGSPSTGTSGGPGQNDGQAANTARIATNTDRLVGLLAEGGSSTTAPSSTTDSGCGRPGQPACSINEGDTAASSSGVAGEIAAHRTGMEDAMDAQKNAVTASASEQFGASSRWVFSAVPFFAGVTATCSLAWPVHIPSLGIDQTYSISICSWTPLWHDFAAWALYAMTAVALWLTIYGKGEK